MKRFSRILNVSAMIYLCVPIILFAFGWLKIYYAIGLTALVVTAAIWSLKNFTSFSLDLRSHRKVILIVILLVVCWVGLSGIGGFSFQNSDHSNRNATLRDLINYKWPVIYDYRGQHGFSPLTGHKGALVYYLAFWLPAALVGKLLGWNAANVALYLWTVIGVLISFFYMSNYLRKFSAYLLLLFIFWSGLDLIGNLLSFGVPALGEHLEWWAQFFQYSSVTTTLFWVFNQTVPIWVIIMLLLNQKNNKNLLFISALCIPYAPLPFIGLSPFVLYWALFKSDSELIIEDNEMMILKKNYKQIISKNLRSVFSFQNIIIPLLIVLIFFSYYGSNQNNVPQHGFVGIVTGNAPDLYSNYLFFCLLEFGLFVWVIYERFKNQLLFWTTFITLALIPFYSAGIFNDFAMRASIPALIILMIYVASYLTDSQNQKRRIILIILVVIGGFTAFQEIYRSVYLTNLDYSHRLADHGYTFGILGKFRGLDKFVVADPERTGFFKYLGK